MTFTERILQTFRFRNPTGTFRPAPAKNQETPVRGEVAHSDPRRLFPGSDKFSTFNPSKLVGAKGLDVFDEMRRDDQVKAALAFKKHACIATGWTVTSPEGKPEDWEVTKFAKWVLENLDPHEIGSATLDGDMYEMLGALDYGFSITEKIWAPIVDGEFAGLVGLKALKTRSPHHITFAQDEYGNLADDGIIQATNGRFVGGKMPRSKFVLFSYQSQFGNPYGTSDLEAAYFPWWTKYNAIKWLAMLLERFGIPPIFGLYTPGQYVGTTTVEDLKKVFTNFQAATNAIIPRPNKDALEFWSPSEAGANATRVFIPALDYLNNAISRAVLMPNLIGMTSDQSQGSYARARVHFDVFLLVVESIRKDLATVMNHQIVRPMLDLNFPGLKEYPRWAFLPLTDDLRIGLLNQWGVLVDKMVVTPQEEDEKHIRKLVQFPERRPGTEMPRPEMGGNGDNGARNGDKTARDGDDEADTERPSPRSASSR